MSPLRAYQYRIVRVIHDRLIHIIGKVSGALTQPYNQHSSTPEVIHAESGSQNSSVDTELCGMMLVLIFPHVIAE